MSFNSSSLNFPPDSEMFQTQLYSPVKSLPCGSKASSHISGEDCQWKAENVFNALSRKCGVLCSHSVDIILIATSLQTSNRRDDMLIQ